MLVRVGVAVQAEEVEAAEGIAVGRRGGRRERGAEGVLVGVEEDVCAVVFVVTGSSAALEGLADEMERRETWEESWERTHSRAQRYGCRARMLGRTHASRLKGDMMRRFSRLQWSETMRIGEFRGDVAEARSNSHH